VLLRFQSVIRSYGAPPARLSATIATTMRRRFGWIRATTPSAVKSSKPPSVPVVEEEESEFVRVRRRNWARLIRKVWLDGHERARAVVDLGVTGVGPSRDGASAHRDDDLRLGDGMIGLLQGQPHVLRHRTGHQQAVGMPRRGDELDAEAPQVQSSPPRHTPCLFSS
jgi:hypothetical protein